MTSVSVTTAPFPRRGPMSRIPRLPHTILGRSDVACDQSLARDRHAYGNLAPQGQLCFIVTAREMPHFDSFLS